MTASWDAAVPMRRRISSNARCPRSGFVLAARACNRRDEPERGRLGDRQAQAPAGGPCTGFALPLSLSMAQFMVVLESDITDEQQAADAVARTVAELGRLDMLINNAGGDAARSGGRRAAVGVAADGRAQRAGPAVLRARRAAPSAARRRGRPAPGR